MPNFLEGLAASSDPFGIARGFFGFGRRPEQPMAEEQPVVPPPPLDLGPIQLPAETLTLTQRLEEIARGIGAGSVPAGTPLPAFPQIQADPANQMLADSAQGRNKQIQQLLTEMQKGAKANDPRNRGNLVRLGEWLSQWAASGNAAAGGAIMAQMLSGEREMAREIDQQVAQLRMQGFSADEAVDMARARVLSGQHQAGQQTQQGQYQRGVAEAERNDRRSMAQFDANSRTAGQRATIAQQIAGIEAQGLQNARAERQTVLETLAGVPEYASQAREQLVPESVTNQDARRVVADAGLREGAVPNLYVQIIMDRSDRSAFQGNNLAGTLAFYRQWDPTLSANDVKELPPIALIQRMLNGTGAAQAFRDNPQIRQNSQFAPLVGEAVP